MGELRHSFPHVQAGSVKIANRLWFWNSRSYPEKEFFDRLEEAFLSATVVGVNPPYRLDVEARSNLLGFMGVLNGNRFILDHIG